MPLPTMRDVRPVDPVLTNLSLGFRNMEFVADFVAPPVRVTEQSATYFTYDRDYWFRRPSAIGARRAPGDEYLRAGYGVSTATYRAVERGFEKAIDDVIRAASQLPDSLDTVATQFLTNLMQLEIELDVAAAAFVTGVWGTSNTLAGANQWSDYDQSDPINNFDVAKRTIRRNTGREPNAALIGALSWENLKEHPLILDKYKYTQKGIMTEDLVAAALGIQELKVGKSIQNTAAAGAAFVGADIWTDNALVLVREPNIGLMVPNGAYNFVWDEKGNFPWAVESYREDKYRSDIVRIFTHYVVSIIASQYGYLFLDTQA